MKPPRKQRNDTGATAKMVAAIRTMPSLRHSNDGEYDIMKSEAAKWMVDNPVVREWVFRQAIDRKIISYDKDSGTWKGIPQPVQEVAS